MGLPLSPSSHLRNLREEEEEEKVASSLPHIRSFLFPLSPPLEIGFMSALCGGGEGRNVWWGFNGQLPTQGWRGRRPPKAKEERGRESISFLSVSVAPLPFLSRLSVYRYLAHEPASTQSSSHFSLSVSRYRQGARVSLCLGIIRRVYAPHGYYVGKGLLLRGLAVEKKTNWPDERGRHMYASWRNG